MGNVKNIQSIYIHYGSHSSAYAVAHFGLCTDLLLVTRFFLGFPNTFAGQISTEHYPHYLISLVQPYRELYKRSTYKWV